MPKVWMASLPKPLAESYWVIPGRLLAGKYPGGKKIQELERRVGPLLDAGFDAFIDLTEAGELPPYEGYLPEGVVYVRKPITDHGVPRDSAFMARDPGDAGRTARAKAAVSTCTAAPASAAPARWWPAT